MNDTPYSFLLIDDHPLITQGLEQLISKRGGVICTQANTIERVKQVTSFASFNLCIIDLEMPGSNGLGLIRSLHHHMPQCRFLIYTMHEEPWVAEKLSLSDVRPCIAGAVSKHCELDELCTAIDAIREGKEYFCAAFCMLQEKKSAADASKLTALSQREREVFVHLTCGLSTPEIAERMNLSTNTIHTYRKRLLAKMDAKNVAELIGKWKGLL